MAETAIATESFYACLHLQEGGSCAAWQRIPLPNNDVDFSILNENFLYGFAIIFSLWSIGFTISVVTKLIKMA